MVEKINKNMISNILWKACDTFRNKIDSSTYKDYILVMLFLKYLSDTYESHKEKLMIKYEGDEIRVERALTKDRFLMHQESTFDHLYANRKQPNIGELIDTALEKIEEDNKVSLRGVFRNISFNSEIVFGEVKTRNGMLKTLLEDFNELNLRPENLSSDDIIGDAYEYMIANFASDAGKKGGEFYTPSAVSKLVAMLSKPKENSRIYDPTAGSGSLLLKVVEKVPNKKVAIYGQEMNGQTHALSKMNMFLHNIDDATMEWGDTLSNPKNLDSNGKLMKFDSIVSNPPFSLDKWANGFSTVDNDKDFKMTAELDPFKRFDYGVPPKSKGDFAFVQHILSSLSAGGRAVIVLPHGVLFRGSTEGKIREQIIRDNLLDAVIGLPSNLFFGTSIPACILVLRNGRNTKDVLFIDASGDENFEKGKNQNVLRYSDIEKIFNCYEDYNTVDKFSYRAKFEEIEENDFNLNIPRYVDTFEEEELVDIDEVKKNIIDIKKKLVNVETQMEKHLKELGL
jgi:type I restriction enzyme M protein